MEREVPHLTHFRDANCVLAGSFIAILNGEPELRILEQEMSEMIIDSKTDEQSRGSSITVKLSKQRSSETIKRYTCGRCGNLCLLM